VPPDPALELLDAARHLADRVWRSTAPPEVRAEVAGVLREAADRLGPPVEGAPPVTPMGIRLPGRGHPLLPPLVRRGGEGRRVGTVTFTGAHAGAGEAVHGGQVCLLFDDVLGGVAVQAAPHSRTGYLTVHFRALTPLGVPLDVEGWVERVDGRKIYVEGRLLDGDKVCAEAESLYIAVDGW